jgi:hypothetical protein
MSFKLKPGAMCIFDHPNELYRGLCEIVKVDFNDKYNEESVHFQILNCGSKHGTMQYTLYCTKRFKALPK